MLIIQDLHIVRGRAELPFEDTYRDELAPPLAEHGARLAFFGWAPHGGGQGYEALVLTTIDDVVALRTYQDALSHGPLAETWTKLEASAYRAESNLLVVSSEGLRTPPPLDGSQGPRALFRLDTLFVSGAAAEAAEGVRHTDDGSDDLLHVLGSFSPALGDLAEPAVTVLSRVNSFDGLHRALGQLTDTELTGTPSVPDLERREVRISRCASWSPIQ